MGRRPCALVVTDDLELADRWMGWLRAAGYMTIGCVGPGLTLRCPLATGDACQPRDIADITIVDQGADAALLCGGRAGGRPTVTIRPGDPSMIGRRDFVAGVAVASARPLRGTGTPTRRRQGVPLTAG